MADNTTQIPKGMHKDASPQNQPKNTYRFALNATEESEQGDAGFRGNAQSNEVFVDLPDDYIVIGHCYVGDEETVLFLAHKNETSSIIGTVTKDANFITGVSDVAQAEKLNFKVSNQVDCTYRLRRGCEKFIYFTDGLNKPRHFNFNSPDDYQDTFGNWEMEKFELLVTSEGLPTFQPFKVVAEGTLNSGSYNIGIAYLGEGFLPTEVLLISETIMISQDSTGTYFPEIGGSTSIDEELLSSAVTNKAITVELSNLDQNYPYYRLYLIEASTGSGTVTKVSYTPEISITQTSYTITGTNTPFPSTEAEMTRRDVRIDTAEHIEQIENRLVLANISETSMDFSELQKSASKINTQCVLKTINLMVSGNEGNSKNPTKNTNNANGYMPGEIYAFGIVYIYDDGSESPVIHIPGRSPFDITGTSNMSLDNMGVDKYEDNTCVANFWGEDHTGNPLVGKEIRHHRFPFRNELGIPLYEDISTVTDSPEYTTYCQPWGIRGTINSDFFGGANDDGSIYIRIDYTLNNVDYFEVFAFPNTYSNLPDDAIVILTGTVCQRVKTFTPLAVPPAGTPYFNALAYNCVEADGDNDAVNPFYNASDGFPTWGSTDPFPGVPEIPAGYYNFNTKVSPDQIEVTNYTSEILGIEFSGVDLPTGVKGYHIVRLEREQNDKTILDTAIMMPVTEGSGFTAFMQMNPNLQVMDPTIDTSYTPPILSPTHHSLISLEHKFDKLEDKSFTEFVREGTYQTRDKTFHHKVIQDVNDYSSYNPDIHKSSEKDDDGMSMNTLIRSNRVSHTQGGDAITSVKESVNFINPVSEIIEEGKRLYNATSDNRSVFVRTDTTVTDIKEDTYPYVALKRNLTQPYSLFRLKPYYREHVNMETASTISLWSGDTDISSISLVHSMTYATRVRRRLLDTDIWEVIGGIALIAAAVLLTILAIAGTIFTGGASLFGLALVGGITTAGTALLIGGVEQGQITAAYGDAFDSGLRDTIKDVDCHQHFDGNPSDDEVQMFHDVMKDVFFESTVNAGLRLELRTSHKGYLIGPTPHLVANTEGYCLNKTTEIVPERKEGKSAIGFALAEVYEINKDYKRRSKQKLFFMLGLEYDYCSKCRNDFFHRVMWSEQSFQEEVSDNYRTFLPNNYRDIEGNTGAITDLFRMQNNLYIHTVEALWHLPQNVQERTTGDVVSFIGTGEYFSLPPRRVVEDATGMSSGTEHKWATIKTPHGVFYVCEKQRMLYKFDGNSLNPISSQGMFNWFKENTGVEIDSQYKDGSGEIFPYKNNPSNPVGSGFVSVYDARKERILFTKRDSIIDETLDLSSDKIFYKDGGLVAFLQYEQIISDAEALGWEYLSILGGVMVFQRETGNPFTPIELMYVHPTTVATDDNSWTLSYSLKTNSWTSFHSYLPNLYYSTPDKFYSWVGNLKPNSIWEHNVHAKYQTYYGVLYPHIIEYVSLSNALVTRTWESIKLLTEAKKYDFNLQEFVDQRYVTYNKGIFYNSRQASGEMELVVKDTQANPVDYMIQQVEDNTPTAILLDRNERDWTVNELRDLRVDYTQPIFDSNVRDLQLDYYIDKMLNVSTIDYEKEWTELEFFRDKYLAIRLIFDNFDDIKLLLNYSIENEIISPR